MKITTIGLDLAKSVFDATGQVVVRKSLRRSQMLAFFAKLPPCLVAIEACGTSHHWARELIKFGEEEISFTRLRARCDVMADRSDRKQGQPAECPRRHSLISRMGPCSRTPSGPAVSN